MAKACDFIIVPNMVKWDAKNKVLVENNNLIIRT